METLTPDNVLQYAVANLGDNITPERISFTQEFNLKIKLDGATWTGKEIDYRIAKFILYLQRDLIGIINSTTDDKVTLKNIKLHPLHPIVKIEIHEGCTEIYAKIADVLNFFSTLSDNKKLIALAITTAMFTTGTLGWRYIDAQKEVAIKNLDETTKQQLITTTNKAIDVSTINSRAINYILNQLEDDDRIQIKDGSKLSRSDAKILMPTKREKIHRETNHIVDDHYEIPTYNYEKQTAIIRIQGTAFPASTRFLPDQEKLELHRLSTEADLKGTFPTINLHVMVIIESNKVKEAIITGIGEKRTGAQSIRDVLMAKAKEEKLTIQASLFDHINE